MAALTKQDTCYLGSLLQQERISPASIWFTMINQRAKISVVLEVPRSDHDSSGSDMIDVHICTWERKASITQLACALTGKYKGVMQLSTLIYDVVRTILPRQRLTFLIPSWSDGKTPAHQRDFYIRISR